MQVTEEKMKKEYNTIQKSLNLTKNDRRFYNI